MKNKLLDSYFDNDKQRREYAMLQRKARRDRPWVRWMLVITFGLLLVALCSCGTNPPVANIQDVKPVDVKPIKTSVVVVRGLADDARRELALAKREAEEARIDAEGYKELLEKMKEAESPFLERVAELRFSYEERLKKLADHILETDKILLSQQEELATTDEALDKAIAAAAVANEANQLLISSNKELKKKADDGAKYKEHYDTRYQRKIKTILWSVGITLAVIIALFVWQWFSNPLGVTKRFARGLLFTK